MGTSNKKIPFPSVNDFVRFKLICGGAKMTRCNCGRQISFFFVNQGGAKL